MTLQFKKEVKKSSTFVTLSYDKKGLNVIHNLS